MATWKKVIVSGSDAELNKLNTGANQQINTSPSSTFLSGSFSGSFQGDGSNLTNIKATGITAAGIISDIQNGTSDTLFVSQSNGLQRITYADFLADLAGTNLTSSNDSLELKANISVTQITASIISASTYIGLPSFQTPSALTQGAGIQAFSFDGSTAKNVTIKTGSAVADNTILKWDIEDNQFQSSSLVDNAVTGQITGGSSIRLTGVTSSLSGSFSGSFYGDGSNLTGIGVNITNNTDGYILRATGANNTLSGSAGLQYNQTDKFLQVENTIKFSGSANTPYITLSSTGTVTSASIFAGVGTSPNTLNIGNPSSTTFIGNDLVIAGDLITNGTASFINTQNLLVADRFITLASGSSTNTDGGIIIQNSINPANTGSGYAFYLETATNTARWAVTSSLALNAVTGNADEYMVTAKIAAGNPTGNPTWGGTDGAGNMYINTSDNSIWIYS